MAIGNITAGQTGTFVATYLLNGQPTSSTPATTPVWSSTDPLVTFQTAADGFSTVATIGASDTDTSVTITVSAKDQNGNTATGSITVAVTPQPQVFSFNVSQSA